MKAGRIVLIVVLTIVILGVASFMIKSDYSVERTTVIEAPKSQVYSTLGDFSQFTKWDPWSKMDPDMTVEYYGEPGTVGHGYKWSGNEDVGSGSMEIINMGENTIEVQLTFLEPFESSSPTSYTINETEDGTSVTWSMTGQVPMAMKMFMDMEAMIGNDFDNGLSSLKTMVESMEAAPVSDYMVQVSEMPNMIFAAKRDQIKISEMDAFWSDENVETMFGTVGQTGAQMGHMAGIYYTWDEENDMADMAMGVVVPEGTSVPGYPTIAVEGGSALMLTHHGSYDGIGAAHEAMEAYIEANGTELREPVLEVYTVAGPDVAEEDQVTVLYYPIAMEEGDAM
ncbi:MAG: SRPBCC family protein [Flavobacteriia bacterium]|nr:SRPBCC family protein [Flavobacteriia bacterium]